MNAPLHSSRLDASITEEQMCQPVSIDNSSTDANDAVAADNPNLLVSSDCITIGISSTYCTEAMSR